MTNAEVQARIADSEGEAVLARSRKTAQQTIVMADSELERSKREAEQTVLLAEADSQQRLLAGRGESQKIMQIGLSEAAVLLRKIGSFGDPRLYALQEVAAQFSHSQQHLYRSDFSFPVRKTAIILHKVLGCWGLYCNCLSLRKQDGRQVITLSQIRFVSFPIE